jgi:hypothetical protein
MPFRHNRQWSSLVSLLVVVLLGWLWAMPASANVGQNQPCAHGGNYSATACVNGNNGEVYTGGFDDFRNVSLTATGASSSNPIHTNQEMWLYTHSNESQWVEMGLRQGYWIPCNCVKYVLFWADFNSAGQEFRHTISYPSADNSVHEYEILRDGANQSYWDVYYDYNYIGQSTNQGSSTGYEVQHGLEVTEISGNTKSGLANHSPLEYRDTSGTFVHDPYQKTWVDSQCPGMTQGTTCLTGYGNGTDVWEAAKG